MSPDVVMSSCHKTLAEAGCKLLACQVTSSGHMTGSELTESGGTHGGDASRSGWRLERRKPWHLRQRPRGCGCCGGGRRPKLSEQPLAHGQLNSSLDICINWVCFSQLIRWLLLLMGYQYSLYIKLVFFNESDSVGQTP